MPTATSRDGTPIGYSRDGSGPAVVLVDGALCHRAVGPNRRLAERLSRDLTVFTYDRRGRGESGDAAPYAVAREVEDLGALIDAAGGSAYVYGISSGGALAMEAAKRLPGKVAALALYEIPFVVDDTRPPVSKDFPGQLERFLAAGQRGAAVKLFMRDAVRLPSVLVAAMPLFVGGWKKNKAIAHTLPYDVAVMGDGQRGEAVPADRWRAVTVPTLVACGEKSPDWVRHAAAQLSQVLPNARHRTLAGQRHYVKPDAMAPVLVEFFAA